MTALDRNDSHPIADGALKVVDNQIDTTTGTFKLKAEFTNEKNVLWPGQFVNVRVQVQHVKGGIVVPATAVQRGPDGSYAYVVQADSTVKMTPLELGAEAGDNTILITKGLAAATRSSPKASSAQARQQGAAARARPGCTGDERGGARQVEAGESGPGAAATWRTASRRRRLR